MAAPLEDILRQHPVWRGGAPGAFLPAISSGYAELDQALPGGGWPTGVLSELLCGQEGFGELGLVIPALAALTWAGKRVLWLAPPHLPYAPALAAAGIDLAQLVIVRARGEPDALWAAEEVLRARSCHSLVAWIRRAGYEQLRRLALAAQGSPAWVALFRPAQSSAEPSPAALRLALQPHGEALAVHILKRRGTPAAAPLALRVTRPFHALGRTAFSLPAVASTGAARRLGVPVHA